MSVLSEIAKLSRAKDWPAVVGLCRPVLQAHPEDSHIAIEASLMLAYALIHSDPADYEQAIRHYERVVRVRGDEPSVASIAREGLGLAYRERKDGERIVNLRLSVRHLRLAFELIDVSKRALLGATLATIGFNFCELSRLVPESESESDYLKQAIASLRASLDQYDHHEHENKGPLEENQEAQRALDWARQRLADKGNGTSSRGTS